MGMTPMEDATRRELVTAIREMRRDFNRVIASNEFKISTATEREKRSSDRREAKRLKKRGEES